MLEGPYQNNRWQERWLNLEGAFQILQVVALVGLAIVFGYEWFAAGSYLKLAVIFGSGLAVLVLAIATRLPLLALGIVGPIVLAWYWP